MRAPLWIAACLLLLAAGAPAGADRAAWDLLWTSQSASDHITIAGRARTMAVIDGSSLSAVADLVAARGMTRFDYSSGDRRWALVDDGKQLIHLHPGHRTAALHRRPAFLIDRTLAERNYRAVEGKATTVAGRPARLVEVTPQGGGSAVQRLWLDRETAFPLKQERYNAEGRLVSGTEYLEVEFGVPVAADRFAIPTGWTVLQTGETGPKLSIAELERRMGFRVRQPTYLPRGYVLLSGHEARWGRWQMHMAELRYTDGIRVLSLYQRELPEPAGRGRGLGRGGGRGGERGGGRGPGRGERRGGGRGPGRGEGVGGGRRGEGRGDGFGPPTQQITLMDRGAEKALRYFGREVVVIVVGDLPAEELVRIARSVAPD